MKKISVFSKKYWTMTSSRDRSDSIYVVGFGDLNVYELATVRPVINIDKKVLK